MAKSAVGNLRAVFRLTKPRCLCPYVHIFRCNVDVIALCAVFPQRSFRCASMMDRDPVSHEIILRWPGNSYFVEIPNSEDERTARLLHVCSFLPTTLVKASGVRCWGKIDARQCYLSGTAASRLPCCLDTYINKDYALVCRGLASPCVVGFL